MASLFKTKLRTRRRDRCGKFGRTSRITLRRLIGQTETCGTKWSVGELNGLAGERRNMELNANREN